MQSIDYIGLENQYGAQNYRPLDVVLSHGQRVWVLDKIEAVLTTYRFANFFVAHISQDRLFKIGITNPLKIKIGNASY